MTERDMALAALLLLELTRDDEVRETDITTARELAQRIGKAVAKLPTDAGHRE